MSEPSTIDARLAEIDRRLRRIQTGLRPAAEPAAESSESPESVEPPTPLPSPTPLRPAAPDDPGSLVTRLQTLGEAHERLLELHRELLDQYAGVLGRTASAPSPALGHVSVTAGPFADAAAVSTFERELATLPGVTAVTVREYLGSDRIALEVTLAAR